MVRSAYISTSISTRISYWFQWSSYLENVILKEFTPTPPSLHRVNTYLKKSDDTTINLIIIK